MSASEVSEVPFWTDEDFYGTCDYVAPDAETCCDAPVAYRVTWMAVPELGNGACSAVCLEHVSKVNRNLIESIRTILDSGASA
jgi:hypothetical protein